MAATELVVAAQAGDRTALAALVDTHVLAAMRLALHLAANRADAEDAVQSALVKAFTHLDRFDASRPFAPWFLKIVANECRRQRRDAGYRWRFWRDRARPDRDDATPEGIVIGRLEQQELYRAFRRLGHDDRLVLSLTYFENWRERDVAALLGIPIGTVKSRKHNALKRLRREADAAGAAGSPGREVRS